LYFNKNRNVSIKLAKVPNVEFHEVAPFHADRRTDKHGAAYSCCFADSPAIKMEVVEASVFLGLKKRISIAGTSTVI
jgi:predicted homoserine dehydrogenase-like protein